MLCDKRLCVELVMRGKQSTYVNEHFQCKLYDDVILIKVT